jgi:hypothetical protein
MKHSRRKVLAAAIASLFSATLCNADPPSLKSLVPFQRVEADRG